MSSRRRSSTRLRAAVALVLVACASTGTASPGSIAISRDAWVRDDGRCDARIGGRDSDDDLWIDSDLRLREVARATWVVTHVEPFGSHSLVAEMPDGTLLLADTPATHDATERLLGWLRARFGERPLVLVDGHFHADAAGGNGAVLAAGGTVYGSDLTAHLIETRGEALRASLVEMFEGEPIAERFAETPFVPPSETFPLEDGLELTFGGETVRVLFPGASHSPDSVATFLPARGVLFGGCMVIGMDRVGYTGDADLEAWPSAIRTLKRLEPSVVVPGHGSRFGADALAHTLRLLEAHGSEAGSEPPRD